MPDNKVLRSLFDEFNPKLKLAKDYNEFATIMSDENNRKDFFNEFNSKLNLAKDYKQFDETLGLKKKDISQPDFQFGSQTSPFGSKTSQTQVPTEVPSVLTEQGKVGYEQEVKNQAQQKQKLSEQLKSAKSAFISAQGEDVARDIEMYQADPELFREVETNTSIGNSIRQGLLTGELANVLPVGRKPNIDELQKIADINYKISRIPQSEASKVWEKEGLKIFKDPLIGATFLAETIGSSLAGLYESGKRTVPAATGIGAAAGAPIGGIGAIPGAGVGVMAGISVAGLNMSTSGDIMNSLKDSGVDITDRDALIKAFSDENKMSEIRTNALKYGVPIMAFDVASAGIAGKLIGGTAGKSIAKKIIAGAGEAGIQSVAGSAGELSGQLASGKKIDWNEIALEGIASLATDAPDVAIGYLGRDKSSSNNKNIVSQINKLGVEVGVEDAKLNLDRDLANGVINPDEYQDGIEFIGKVVSANKKVPSEIEGDNREASIELVTQKEDILSDIKALEERKAQTDDAYHPIIDNEIVSKQSQVDEINTKIQEEAVKPSVVKQLDQPKTKQDAIQEQAAGQVPVQPEVPVSEKVEQGKPEAKPKVVTEKGKEVVSTTVLDKIPRGNTFQERLAPDYYEKLKKDIKENGIKEPIILTYYPKDNALRLSDGHHRLAIAKELGITDIPTKVNVAWSKSIKDNNPDIEGQPIYNAPKTLDIESYRKRDYFPSNVKLDEIGLSQATKPKVVAEEGVKTEEVDGGLGDVDLKGDIEGSAYILKNYKNAKKYPNLKVGDVVKISIRDVMPAIGIELGNANAKPYTDSPISVNVLSDGTIRITDGHNRFKKALLDGDKEVEIKVVKIGGANVYDSRYNTMAIKAVKEGRITAQNAKSIIEKAGLEVPKEITEQSLKEQPKLEQTPAQQVEQLRADEQAELKAAIPNSEQYLTDGKVDKAKITDDKDLKKFDEIYDKYDKLITPLLPKTEAETSTTKPVEELKQDVKKAKGKAGKTAALQTLKENSTPEDFNAFMDENPSYKKYESKAKPVVEQEITDESEIDLPSDKKATAKEKLAELEKQKDELLKKIRKAGAQLNVGFSPEAISDLVKLGAIYVQQGVITFKEFADQLKKDYGKDIPEDVVRDIFRKSAKSLGLGVRRTPERIGTGEAVSDSLREVANETDALYQTQNYKEIQERLDNMSEAEKNALVGTLANVTGQLNAEGNVGVLAAIDLINMYEANGNKAGAQRVFDIISKSATAFAQLLRQYGQLKSSTPQGYVSIIEKQMLDKYGVKLTDAQKQAIEKLYSDSKKAIDIESDALNNLVDNLKSDPNYDGNIGYKVYGEATVLAEDANRRLADYIDSLKPATAQSLFQKLTSIVQGNLLSLKSLLLNPVANAAQAGVKLSNNEVANLFDFIINTTLKTGKTKISGFDPLAIRLGGKAFARGLAKANRMLIKGATSTDLAKIDVAGRLKPVEAWKSLYKTLRGKQAFEFVKTIEDLAEGTIGTPANLSLRLLPYGDLPRNEQVKIAKLIEIGRNKFGLKGNQLEAFTLKPDPESLAEAELEGDKSTLQEPNKIYTFLNNVINSIDSKADDKFVKGLLSGIKFVVRGTIVPFLKTPINYAAKAVRFTNPIIPYSQAVYHMVKAIKAAKDIKNPLLRESAIRKHQSKLTEYLGEAVVAQSIMSGALILIGYGLVTGDAPDDKKEKDLMYQSLGPNMINISGLKRLLTGGDPTYKPGDAAIAYNALGILGAQLGISYNTLTSKEKENIRKKKFITTEGKPFYEEDKGFYLSSIQAMSSNLPASLNFTLNQGFAQGTGTLLASVQDNEYSKWSNQLVKTLVTGLGVPNTVYQSFKAGNDYYRNVYTDDQVKTWSNIVKERYGNTKDLPINYDMWGKPIKLTPEGSNPYFYHVLDIFRTQKILQDKNTYYVFDLHKKTGDNSVIPSSVTDIIKDEGGLYKKLTPEQESELERMVGEERAKYINGTKKDIRGNVFTRLSMKDYDPNNNDEVYWQKMVEKLKDAYSLGMESGKRRFEKEVLSKTKK
jgi:hypothetical protein